MNINSIYLRNFNKFMMEPLRDKPLTKQQLATLLKNVSKFGYTLSSDIIDQLNQYNLESVYKELKQLLTEMLGANKNWTPMYPNFPKQVMDASEAELYLNAIFHYLGDSLGLRIMPEYVTEKRSIDRSVANLKIINLGSFDDFMASMTKTYASTNAYTPQDKEDFINILSTMPHLINDIVPKEFTNKENMCFISSVLLKNKEIGENQVKRFIKNSTDVLRLATAMSEGDISLAKNTKFVRFNRPLRRFFISCLEQCPNKEEDMIRHKNKWIKLAERLHPGDYAKIYVTSFKAINTLRNKPETIETFNNNVERFIQSDDVKTACDLLVTRPSELARRLNKLLSIVNSDDDFNYVIDSFKKVVSKIPPKLLLDLLCYFNNRTNIDPKNIRIFFPKGMTTKAQCRYDNRKTIKTVVINKIKTIITDTVISNLSDMEPLGKVYIDEQFKTINLPFATRSASKSLNPLSRGSRINLDPNSSTIRMFIWWKNMENGDRVDIDLSTMIFDDKWNNKFNISYRNLTQFNINSYHSGDITSAPNGACEFIDIDIDQVLKRGCRYIAMSINSYTTQPYNTVPECSAGWMERKNPNSGEIFEPKTVKQKFDLTMNATVAIPMVVDCLERKVIWMDMAVTSNHKINNIQTNLNSTTLLLKAFSEMKKPTMYDLLSLHAQARGLLVTSKENAITIFSTEIGSTPEAFNI